MITKIPCGTFFQKAVGSHGIDPAAQYKCPAWMYNICKQGILYAQHAGKNGILRRVDLNFTMEEWNMDTIGQKELARKDIERIAKLDAQIDYSQAAVVEQYYKQITQKGILTTPVGKKYMERLKLVVDSGADWHKCLFCGSRTQGNTMICPACKAKLAKQPARFCRSCGKQMPAGSSVCPACGKKDGEGYQYCAHCGKEVPLPDLDFLSDYMKRRSKDFAGQTAKIARKSTKNMAKQGRKLNQKQGAKNIVAITAIAFAILAVVGALLKIGQQIITTVLVFCAFLSLGRLIYKAVKKEPWKRAAAIFVVSLLLLGAADALGGAGSVGGNNVLDYIGAKESAVYKVYGKDGFYSDGICTVNERNNTSGLPHIFIDDGEVVGCKLVAGMDAALHVSGLHIGDNKEQIEPCMKQLHADKTEDNLSQANGSWHGTVTYTCRYHKKNVTITIVVSNSVVNQISF